MRSSKNGIEYKPWLDQTNNHYNIVTTMLIHTWNGTRKLPHYFQAHTVVILTQLPFKTILRSADYAGRIAKWGTLLGAFDIKYMPRTSIKGQVIADLVAEFTEPEIEESLQVGNIDEKLVGTISQGRLLTWEAYVDGVSN